MDFDSHRLSFGAAAEHYDRSRPTYPVPALQWILGDQPRHVVDLGAGTGLLTRVALKAGHHLVPVEPDPGMRTQLDAATPGTTALAGSAEHIPLPDSSVDAVIAGQAYHWFDKDKAHPEIARVLKPGGVFATLSNERDNRTDWTAKLSGIMNGGKRHAWIHPVRPDFGPLFADVEEQVFAHLAPQTPQGLCDLVASRSYYLVASSKTQVALLAQVRDLCATHPDLRGKEEFDLPYETRVHRAFKR